MRWLTFFSLSTTCLAGYGGPLPEIKVGTTSREMTIVETDRDHRQFVTSKAFLVGTVVNVEGEVETTPRETTLSEACTLKVESAFGYLDDIQGISSLKLISTSTQSPYVPIENDWGRLQHLKPQQRIAVLLSEDEWGLSFAPEALVDVGHKDELPGMLQRTAFCPIEFTDQELQLLKSAWPWLHDQVFADTAIEREMFAAESLSRRRTMIKLAAIAGLVILAVFVGIRLLRRG